jgi:DNA-binding HxlR family transcriptional regulator
VTAGLDELAAVVADLGERVTALEAGAQPTRRRSPRADLALVQSIVDELPEGDDGRAGDGVIVYAGAGPGPDGLTAYQTDHRWSELLAADPNPMAVCLAAFGNGQRILILQLLLRGRASTAELTAALGTASSGQLFHHLKELLAAGLIYQPSRGSYAVRPQRVIALLTILACAADLASPAEAGDR